MGWGMATPPRLTLPERRQGAVSYGTAEEGPLGGRGAAWRGAGQSSCGADWSACCPGSTEEVSLSRQTGITRSPRLRAWDLMRLFKRTLEL